MAYSLTKRSFDGDGNTVTQPGKHCCNVAVTTGCAMSTSGPGEGSHINNMSSDQNFEEQNQILEMVGVRLARSGSYLVINVRRVAMWRPPIGIIIGHGFISKARLWSSGAIWLRFRMRTTSLLSLCRIFGLTGFFGGESGECAHAHETKRNVIWGNQVENVIQ